MKEELKREIAAEAQRLSLRMKEIILLLMLMITGH